VQYCGHLAHFSHNTAQLPLKTLGFSKDLKFSFKLITLTFTLLLEHHLLFAEADFCKIKGKEILRRLHDFNTTENNRELTESFPASTELSSACGNLKSFGFEISSDFFNLWPHLVKTTYNKSANKRAYCIVLSLKNEESS
jgi:hypothetical protein